MAVYNYNWGKTQKTKCGIGHASRTAVALPPSRYQLRHLRKAVNVSNTTYYSCKMAKEDGIKCVNGYYIVTCSVCGKNHVKTRVYGRERKYICEDCKDIEKGKADQHRFITKETKFQDAISRIEAQTCDVEPYRKAMESVHKTLHRTGWYRSTEEIMTALELLKNNVKTIHQQPVGRYRVDFVLPDMKVLLEIDGSIYHNSDMREKEGIRDGSILLAMGTEWEMIRLDAARINKDVTKLLPAINSILEERRNRKK